MARAMQTQGGTYVSPSRKTLAGKLLKKARQKTELKLQTWEEEGIKKTGFVLQSDGYDDNSKRPLINTLLSTPRGSKFHSAKDAEGT